MQRMVKLSKYNYLKMKNVGGVDNRQHGICLDSDNGHVGVYSQANCNLNSRFHPT